MFCFIATTMEIRLGRWCVSPSRQGRWRRLRLLHALIRQKIQISSAVMLRRTNAETDMVKPPNDVCPASTDPQSWRQSVTGKWQNPSETQADAKAKSTPRQKEELGQCCPWSVSTCQHPFIDSQEKLLEPVLVFSGVAVETNKRHRPSS